MRLLLLILRWQTRRAMTAAAALDDQAAYPVLRKVDAQLTGLLEAPVPCLHHIHGCPPTCDLRGVR